MSVRVALFLALASTVTAAAAPGLDPEAKTPYSLRLVFHFAENPALTPHFRVSFKTEVKQGLQNALGVAGTVESADLSDAKEPFWKLVAEKGLESLSSVNTIGSGKTHFLFVDLVDGKYVVRSRQYDAPTGFATAIVRSTETADRNFIARLTTLAVGRDFGAVGTFDTPGQNTVAVTLQGSALAPLTAWVQPGEVFGVLQIREIRRPGKAKGEKPTLERTGTRLDGVLLQAIEAPREGRVVCKLWNRYRGNLPRDGNTIGYRCVKLGTGEGSLQLRLADLSGNPLKVDSLRVRAAAADYPEAPKEKDELVLRDGVYVSQEPLRHIAFVGVQSGATPIARFPVEIYPGQIAIRKVKYDPNAPTSILDDLVDDMVDRIRSARVIQEKAREELVQLQRVDRTRALDFGQKAAKSMNDESLALRGDLGKLKARVGKQAAAGRLEVCEGDLKVYQDKNQELLAHLEKLKEVIKIENDPKTAAKRKEVEGLLLEAKLLKQQAEYDGAIAKYEEAIRKTEGEESAKAELQKTVDAMKQEWATKDAPHRDARKFIYDVWAKLDRPQDVRDRLPEARKAFEKCKAIGDRIALLKMATASPQVLERYAEGLKKLIDDAKEDEDRKALEGYPKVSEDLEKLANEIRDALK
jgi:tetratricopeptide (TPR) repeat protein